MTTMLSLRHISKSFPLGQTTVHAVRDVSLDVPAGQCLAIVGESGSGKTTLAHIMLSVFPPSSGEIFLDEKRLPQRRRLADRKAIQLVQQNPLSSLNPKRSVGASIRLGLDVYNIGTPAKRRDLVAAALAEVDLPGNIMERRPASLSGGQRQRVSIARALACQPRAIIFDEPTSSLDVLVQARILRLLYDLQVRKKLTYVFITHDLAVVRNIAQQVAVLQSGQLIEHAPTSTIFTTPQTDYTRTLISAIPVVSPQELALRNTISKQKG